MSETSTPSKKLAVEPGAFKTEGAAAYLSLNPETVLRLVKRGLLRPSRATRHLLFSRASLDQFLADSAK